MIGTLYVRCNHFCVEEQQVLQRGMRYRIISEYDWCPLCHLEMEEKRDKMQTTFDETFGDPSGSKDS